MGRPSSEASRDTRRDILEAALDLFAENGFHGASMRALATAVGVRESAIYHWFPSKTALLEAVVAEFAAARAGEVELELQRYAERSLEELLSALAHWMLNEISSPRYRKLVRVMTTAPAAEGDDEPLWRRVTEEPRRLLGRVLSQLKRAGKVRDDLELELFHVHFVAPLFVAGNALFGGGRGPLTMPLQRFVRHHVAFMVQAMAPAPARAAARR